MTSNPNFTTPSPALLTITTSVNTLETTYQQGLAGNHASKALQKTQRKAANALMQQLKTYVQTTSTTPEIAVTSGMTLRKTATPHNELTAPQNVRVAYTGTSGAVKSMWKGVANRKSYLVYSTTNLTDVWDRSHWTLLGTTGSLRFVASGLTVGTKYALIVIAVGARDIQSPPSDPAIVTAA